MTADTKPLGTYAVVWHKGVRHVIGGFAHNARGWRFIPYTQRSPSRKDWPTPQDALPNWCGHATIVRAEDREAARTGAGVTP